MCIAIWKEKDMLLSKDTLKNSWDANPDGAGFMYAEEGKVHIVKGLMTFQDFLEAYEPHKDKACALHFRIATHGNVDAANTHPFRVSDTLGLVHNGIINNISCDIDTAMSDTWHFTEKIMKPFEQHWQHPGFQSLVENFIGFSKLILLDGEGNFSIYNEKQGMWDCQCWFSNSSYKRKTYPAKTQTTSSWKKDTWKCGDIAITHWEEKVIGFPEKTIKKGTKVKIESFGQGVFVWVVSLDADTLGYRCKISSYGLFPVEENQCLLTTPINSEFYLNQEVVFSQNYNHFRVGDTGIVTSVSNYNVLLTEPRTIGNKNYLVPKTHIQPATLLLN